jgi:hypothetical protein
VTDFNCRKSSVLTLHPTFIITTSHGDSIKHKVSLVSTELLANFGLQEPRARTQTGTRTAVHSLSTRTRTTRRSRGRRFSRQPPPPPALQTGEMMVTLGKFYMFLLVFCTNYHQKPRRRPAGCTQPRLTITTTSSLAQTRVGIDVAPERAGGELRRGRQDTGRPPPSLRKDRAAHQIPQPPLGSRYHHLPRANASRV